MKKIYRATFLFLAVLVSFALFMWVLAWVARGRVPTRPAAFDAKAAAAAETLRDVDFDRDPAKLPTPYRDIHVKPQHESPLLSELVKKNVIPPLQERMPEDPVVMEGPDGIGNYGGTWLRLANTGADIGGSMAWRMSGSTFLRWSPLGYPIKPYIAESVESDPTLKVWTITLRKGMRWSNGDLYTTDDIMYWWKTDVHNAVDKTHVIPEWLRLGGKEPLIEKIDDYHFRVTFAVPYAFFREQLCFQRDIVGVPSKYLRPFNFDPKIGDQALIKREMAAYKLPSARALYGYMRNVMNTDLPKLSPWIYKSYRSLPPQVFVRNPYFFAVDPKGNQLPYIDRVQFDLKENVQIMTISSANGDASMQDRSIDFSGYTEFMSRRDIAGTKVLHWYPATRALWAINLNQNRAINPADPSTGWKEKMLSDKHFRQALSLAINRKQIITAEYNGVGTPSQVSPGPMSDFDNPDLAKKYTQFDPAEANKLLDNLGLTHRDYEGYRTFPDKSRMTFFIDYCTFTGEGPMQFVLDDWKAVGVRVMRRFLSRPLLYAYYGAGDFDMSVWTSESDIYPFPSPWPNYFIASHSFYAPAWSRWYDNSGLYGNPRADLVGVNPDTTPNGKPMYKAMQLYDEAQQAPDRKEQIRLFRQIQEIDAENVWTIGIATAPPGLAIITKDLKNVPSNALVGATFSTPANTGIETYYFDPVIPNPSADAALVEAITHPTNRPGSEPTVKPTLSSQVLKYSFTGIAVLLALLIMFKHPFILRRVLVLIPSLILMSIIVFAIVQLPPGDFLQNKQAELEAESAPNIQQQLDDMARQFHTNDSMVKNYLRWTGALWFVTYKDSDQGLLQGNLGRSMASGLPVNDIIGDRITLTVLLSLGTVLFTWALAIPIGIWSATRQYTTSDYILTLLGFIGMSVPGFLLALVLMALFGLTGLYSPEFATQPGWSIPKFIDLMEHLWIPILVLAIGGTAGMIRIMRANLLDELKKPYMVTAVRKACVPVKLLVKLPVRIALNPFVSGIGHLFPALVSGGSIVAIVLALPMVGPALLDALFAQDVYLAGSMLMVLSVLGVLGTLVSDLLLLWIDPRIRYEGGSR